LVCLQHKDARNLQLRQYSTTNYNQLYPLADVKFLWARVGCRIVFSTFYRSYSLQPNTA